MPLASKLRYTPLERSPTEFLNDVVAGMSAPTRSIPAKYSYDERGSILFDLDRFKHLAFYNQVAGRIEMHLFGQCQHRVTISGLRFEIGCGERFERSIPTNSQWMDSKRSQPKADGFARASEQTTETTLR